MPNNISIDDLDKAIQDELTIYSGEIIEDVKAIAKAKTSELVKLTKATAPVGKRKKHYKSYISSKKLGETARSISYLWYVKSPEYRLSHLLNNGHATRNGGRVKGTGFITKASEKVLDEYEEEVREAIQKK